MLLIFIKKYIKISLRHLVYVKLLDTFA